MDPEPERLPTDDDAGRSAQDVVPVLVTDLANKTLAVKEGETFLYSDTEVNLDDRKDYGLGLYHRDTRFLSHFMMRLSGREPVLLSSSSERAYMAHVDHVRALRRRRQQRSEEHTSELQSPLNISY